MWEGNAPLLKLLAMIIGVMGIVIVAWWVALLDIEAALGGRDCVADYCPKADRKSGLTLLIAPAAMVILIAVVPLLLSARNAFAVTSERVLSLHNAFWLKRPKLKHISVHGAQAVIDGPFALRVYERETGKQVILTAKSRGELRRAKSIIDSLSQISRTTSEGNP